MSETDYKITDPVFLKVLNYIENLKCCGNCLLYCGEESVCKTTDKYIQVEYACQKWVFDHTREEK